MLGWLLVEALLKLTGELLEVRDSGVNFVHLFDSVLVPLLTPVLDFDQLVSLCLVHGFETLSKGLQERLHRLTHLLVEAIDL